MFADEAVLAAAEYEFKRRPGNEKKDFNAQTHINAARQKRAINRVYSTADTAELAASMLRKQAHHHRVAAVPILFG